MLPNRPNAAAIREYRDANECGLQEAKAALERQWRKVCLQQLKRQAIEAYSLEVSMSVLADLIELVSNFDD